MVRKIRDGCNSNHIGAGGMSGYLQFLLAPLFLEVNLANKEVSKKIFQKFSILAVCPQKNLLAKNWLFESRKLEKNSSGNICKI